VKQKFIDAHMKVAETYASLSSATRLKVGCVIVKNDTIIGIGYNGMPSGWDNVCEEVIYKEPTGFEDAESLFENGWTFGTDKDTALWFKKITKSQVIHAEINAISKVAKSTNSSDGAYMFITHAPCMECSKAIYQSGIKKIFYKNEYRDLSGLQFLRTCAVEVEKVNA
jgi:dCMP deaminase